MAFKKDLRRRTLQVWWHWVQEHVLLHVAVVAGGAVIGLALALYMNIPTLSLAEWFLPVIGAGTVLILWSSVAFFVTREREAGRMFGELERAQEGSERGHKTALDSQSEELRRVKVEHEDQARALRAEIESLKEDRPRLSACLVDRGHTLFLSVTNDGAPADVWASIAVTGDTSRPKCYGFAIWRDTPEDVPPRQRHIERIAKSESRTLVIAEMHSAGKYNILYHRYVPFILAGEHESTHSAEGAVPCFYSDPSSFKPEVGSSSVSRQEVALRVFSDKTSLLPPIQCDITLLGCDRWEMLSGVPLCPPVEERDLVLSDTLQDQWDSFYMVAGETLARLNALRNDSEPSDESWSAFKRLVQEALSLAGGLPEAYRDFPLSLLRTFSDAPKSSFGPCFVVAPDLMNWLLRTNEHFQIYGYDAAPPEPPPDQ
jgi:hypothetical protein